MLESMGLEPVGCCGHAGSFGYEAEHHPVSMQIGELVLLPAARAVSRDHLLIADGFSCRQQIQHGTGRWAMHPVEVMALALESRGTLPQELPERRYLEAAATPGRRVTVAGLAIGIALSALAVWRASPNSDR